MPQTQLSPSRRPISPRRILALGVALAVLAILLSSVVELYKKHRAIRAHIYELTKDKAALEGKYQAAVALNERIETREGKEYILRDKYRMVKPGEGLIVVTNETTLSQEEEQKPPFRRFWDSILRGLGRTE